jgi:hypothetical protein
VSLLEIRRLVLWGIFWVLLWYLGTSTRYLYFQYVFVLVIYQYFSVFDNLATRFGYVE